MVAMLGGVVSERVSVETDTELPITMDFPCQSHDYDCIPINPHPRGCFIMLLTSEDFEQFE